MKKIALLFPGQGAQYIGMGKKLCEEYLSARETFEEANDVLGFDLRKLCFEGSMEELTKTENTQPAILTASIAAFRVYMQISGIEPLYCAGHSLGEYSALVCSGAMGFDDALKIVQNRGRFIQEAVADGVGAMGVVSGVARDVIEEECRKACKDDRLVVLSNINSPDQIAVSGHKSAVDEVGQAIKALGGSFISLNVSAPFHSPLMQPAAERLKEELMKYEYYQLKYQVISNVTALPYEGKESIIHNLTTQVVQPVNWQASMAYLDKQGIETAIEMGPQTVLRNLMKKNAPGIKTFSYDQEEDFNALIGLKQGASVIENGDREAKLKLITRCIAIAVCTKNSNWNDDEYDKGVVKPYRRVQEMLDNLENEGTEPSIEQMNEALEMLRSVFATKFTPLAEQIERFNQVFDESGLRHLFPDFKMPE